LERADLKRYLFLLTKLGLIAKTRYGDNPFYIAAKDALPLVEYGTKTLQFRQERARLKTKVLEYYAAEDRPRSNAWKSVIAKREGAK